MREDYIAAALARATHRLVADGARHRLEVPCFAGVWALGATEEEGRAKLRAVLEDWIDHRLTTGERIPALDGIDLQRAARVD